MKISRFLLICVFIITFPTLNNSLKCQTAGECGSVPSINKSTITKIGEKECNNSCAWFRCYAGSYRIMEGAGCYEDFNTVCKYVKGKPSLTDVDISHVYQDYIFSGCKKSDNCAKKEFDSFVGTDYIGENVGASSVKMFAANYTSDFSFSYKCQYDNKRASIPLFPKLTVNVKGICIAATDFINRPFNSSDWFLDEMEKKSNKSCEENVGFICSINNGEAVKIGFGCYEDFQFACNETIPSNISRNTRNFHYSDENLVILSCSEHYLCAEVELNRYLQVLSRTSSPIVKANPKSSTNCTFEFFPIPVVESLNYSRITTTTVKNDGKPISTFFEIFYVLFFLFIFL